MSPIPDTNKKDLFQACIITIGAKNSNINGNGDDNNNGASDSNFGHNNDGSKNEHKRSITCSAQDDCGSLPNVDNGTLTLQDGCTCRGCQALLECDSGYDPSPSNVTECLQSGVNSTWSSVACIIKVCVEPAIEHGSICYSDFNCGSFATVICDLGYTPTPGSISCTSSGIFENATCEPASCLNTTIDDATTTSTGEGVIGDTITFTCATGFEPCDCVETTSCVLKTPGGPAEWSPEPRCTDIDCGPPTHIPGGNVKINDDTLFGMTANVTCGYCYSVTEPTITCEANGWSTSTCDMKVCAVPNVEHGTLDFTDLNCGTRATVICELGYTPTQTTSVCTSSGMFENVVCVPVACPNTTIDDATTTSTGEGDIGDTIGFTCATGFEPCDCVETTSCVLKTPGGPAEWSPQPRCTDIDCGPPTDKPGGAVELNDDDTLFGMTANVSCGDCYSVTEPTITCGANGWSTSTCDIKVCAVPIVAHGTIEYTDLNCGTRATVICELGYTSTPNTVVCTPSGMFGNAICVPAACPNTTIDNAITTSTGEGNIGDTIGFTCATGFEPCDCVETTSCVLKTPGGPAEWSPEPRCTDIDCGPPTNIPGGNVELHDDTLFGMTANVLCGDCYTVTEPTITCGANGWSTSTCDIKSCVIPILEQGNICLPDLNCGTQATVHCDLGLTPSNATIECGPDGNFGAVSCT